jgi:hypothetical protein
MTGLYLLPTVIDFILARGWPVAIGTSADGKGPRYAGWQNGVTLDQAESLLIQHPHAMAGVILGPRAGIWDLEVDAAEGLPIVAKALGDDPPVTPMFQRAGGFPHRVFAWHQALEAVQTTVVKIDKIHDGKKQTLVEFRLGHCGAAQTIFPPSGGRRWLIHPDDCPFAAPPDCLIKFIMTTARRQSAPPPSVAYVPPAGPVSISTANLCRATRELIDHGAPQESGWNHALFAAACDLCGCGVPLSEAEAALIAAALPWNRGEERTVLATIRSAYHRERRPARPPRTHRHHSVRNLPPVRFSLPAHPIQVGAS